VFSCSDFAAGRANCSLINELEIMQTMNKVRPFFGVRVRAWTDHFLDLVLPRHCVACGQFSGSGNLCRPCSAELPRILSGCVQCGMWLSLETDALCAKCVKKPPPWDWGIAGLVYHFPVDQILCRFKFNRNLACGQILGKELVAAVVRTDQPRPEAIVPVPLHRGRQFTRSFNQAETLARQAAWSLRIPIRADLLSRRRRTGAQSGLDAAARRKNIRGAFSCRPTGIKHVALLDDVLTYRQAQNPFAQEAKRPQSMA
jgi:ComF family protein